MDRYQREEKPRPDVPIMDNEIRIGIRGMPRNYITHAITLLTERGASTVVLKALGNAISKAVTVAEIIKRRILNLHHNTTISSAPVTYTLEPVEEGLLPLETMRQVSMITITLSTTQLDTLCTGYQLPLLVDQVKPLPEHEYEGDDFQVVLGKGRARGRGTGRGGNAAFHHQNGGVVQDNGNYNDFGMRGGYVPPRPQGHGRGRSSGNAQYGNGSFNDNGRGAHGRSRSGYDGNYSDNRFRRDQGRGQGRFGGNDEDGGDVSFGGRGRGRGRARGRGGRN